MRKIKLVFLLFIVYTLACAQDQQKPILISHYIFPEFVTGTVLKKTGIREAAPLNYNTLTREMIFEQKGKHLALAQLNTLDTVFVGGRKFIPVDSAFYEVIRTNASSALYVNHLSTVKIPGAPVGYGATTETSSAVALSSIPGLSGGKSIYDLHLPDNFEVQTREEFYIRKNMRFLRINSLKQVLRTFPNKAAEIKKFAAEHHPNLSRQEDLLALMNYIGK